MCIITFLLQVYAVYDSIYLHSVISTEREVGMVLSDELRKIQILTNIIDSRLRRYPNAYSDRSDRINPTAFHNLRADIMHRIEDWSQGEYIVKVEDGKAVLWNRQEYFRKRGWVR